MKFLAEMMQFIDAYSCMMLHFFKFAELHATLGGEKSRFYALF